MTKSDIVKIIGVTCLSALAAQPLAATENTRILDSKFDRAFNDERTFKPMKDDDSWVQGWIAESYFAPMGVMLHNPVGDPIDVWRDSGRSFYTTDFMYAFDKDRTYIYNAGTLRHGAIRIDKIGNYRLHGYIDRYYSFGQPNCSMKLAIDGTTIFDQNYTFEKIKSEAIVTKSRQRRKKLSEIFGYKESSEFMGVQGELKQRAAEQLDIQNKDGAFYEARIAEMEAKAKELGVPVEELLAKQEIPQRKRTPDEMLIDAMDAGAVGRSSIFEITEAGYYNLNVWIFCKDVQDSQQLFNNANYFGLIEGKKLGMWQRMMSGGKSYLWAGLDLTYANDKVILDGMAVRRNINAVKASVAENFGTFGELVLENVDTGKKARITGETIFHKKEFTPRKDILRPSISPKSAIQTSNWHFRASRGRMSDVYVQEGHESPIFTQAIQNFSFEPTRIMARKKFILPETGKYGVAIAFNPIAYDNTFAYYISGAFEDGKKYKNSIFGGGQFAGTAAENPLDAIRKEVAKRPVSDFITVYIQRKLNNGKYERIKFFEGNLMGAGPIGELRMDTMVFERGQYELVVVADPKALSIRDRLGDLTLNLATNSAFSILVKRPSSDTYKALK